MKDIEVGLSKPYENIHIGQNKADSVNYVHQKERTNFTTVKKRLGGRIR